VTLLSLAAGGVAVSAQDPQPGARIEQRE